MRIAYFLIFWLLDIVPGFGCGSVVAVQTADDGGVMSDTIAVRDTVVGDTEGNDGPVIGDTALPETVKSDAAMEDGAGPSCAWDPMPYAVRPCDDGVHAVCCYTRPDDSCDGLRTDCRSQGFECVLSCTTQPMEAFGHDSQGTSESNTVVENMGTVLVAYGQHRPSTYSRISRYSRVSQTQVVQSPNRQPIGKESAMSTEQQVIMLLDTKSIALPAWNSRISFDEDELASLMEEIKRDGQTSPIEVEEARNGDGSLYSLHFGSRRLEACKRLGRPVKAVIAEGLSAKEQAFRNAAENTQRADLTTFELARTFAHLRELETPIQETADRLGFSKGYVSMLVQVYSKLADPIKDAWERASTIERERMPGKVSDRQKAEIKATAIDFLYKDIIKMGDDAKQVEAWEQAVVALMVVEDEDDDDGDSGSNGKGKGKKGKGKSSAKETIYRVTASRYGDTMSAFKKAMADDPDGFKTVRLACQYLVGDIDKVKGVIDSKAEKKESAKA